MAQPESEFSKKLRELNEQRVHQAMPPLFESQATGGPASTGVFQRKDGSYEAHAGLTILDHYAIEAMKAILAKDGIVGIWKPENIIKISFEIGTHAIAARAGVVYAFQEMEQQMAERAATGSYGPEAPAEDQEKAPDDEQPSEPASPPAEDPA